MPPEEYYLAKAVRLRDVAASLAEAQPVIAQEMLDLAEKFEADARGIAGKSVDTGDTGSAATDDYQQSFRH